MMSVYSQSSVNRPVSADICCRFHSSSATHGLFTTVSSGLCDESPIELLLIFIRHHGPVCRRVDPNLASQ